jgi:uncharacterized protein (TIGR03437 family)
VLNSCDVLSGLPAGDCVPLVTRVDDSLVDALHPARAGEKLTVAAVGLGHPAQAVANGAAAPQTAPTVDDVLIAFDSGANQAPGMPVAGLSSASAATARLRPGAVGIYEIEFTVPLPAPGTPACGSGVESNLTVTIGRTASFDGVGICVEPAAAQQDVAGPRLPQRRAR